MPKQASSQAAKREQRIDALALLKADRKELFKSYDELVDAEGDDGEKAMMAAQICSMLTVHATIEEEIFYPAARENIDDQDLLDEAEVEHASVKDLISSEPRSFVCQRNDARSRADRG